MKAKNAPPAEDLKADKYPEVIKQVNPKYPEKATQEGIEGTVWTKMWIDEAGNVVEVKIAKTERAELNEAAIDAGKQWKFKPALIDGKPVAVWITVPFRFKLSAK
jgi:protein TonB